MSCKLPLVRTEYCLYLGRFIIENVCLEMQVLLKWVISWRNKTSNFRNYNFDKSSPNTIAYVDFCMMWQWTSFSSGESVQSNKLLGRDEENLSHFWGTGTTWMPSEVFPRLIISLPDKSITNILISQKK